MNFYGNRTQVSLHQKPIRIDLEHKNTQDVISYVSQEWLHHDILQTNHAWYVISAWICS